MPALGENGPRPESIGDFFQRTDPFHGGASELFATARQRRRSVERANHETPPPAHILLAREIVELGVANIRQLEEEKGGARVFPQLNSYEGGSVFKMLDTKEDKDLVKYSYAAVIFGVTVEFLYDTFTDPINEQGPVYFNRREFAERLNRILWSTHSPKIEPEKHLPVASSSDLDPETRSERLSETDSDRLRAYIAKTGTYDMITPELEFRLPESLRRFLQTIPFARELIMQPGSGSEAPSIRNLYHERATALLQQDHHDMTARRLLTGTTDAPLDVDEQPAELPSWLTRDDWNF